LNEVGWKDNGKKDEFSSNALVNTTLDAAWGHMVRCVCVCVCVCVCSKSGLCTSYFILIFWTIYCCANREVLNISYRNLLNTAV